MKRKAIALTLVVLACVCVWLGLNATKNAVLAWLLAAAFVVLAVLIWKGKKPAEPRQPAVPSVNETMVYAVKNGHVYHHDTICPHVYGHDRVSMTRAQAKKLDLTPCKKCYPHGD